MALYDDPRVLRAIAHPTRNRILSELFAAGSLRAADIARLMEIPANQASFHLRQLAKYGLVEEAPDEARDKRDRVWRLVDPAGISFRTEDMIRQPGGEAAFEVFRRSGVAWGHLLVDRAFRRDPSKSGQQTISEWALRLTRAEVEEFTADMGEVVDRWRTRTQEQGQRPHDDLERDPGDARETYSIFQIVQPFPEQTALEGGSEQAAD